MADDQPETILDEEEPPGLDFLCSSFLNHRAIKPLRGSPNLLQVRQENITVRVETNLETCRELFEQFSPKKTLFELWGFRYAFYMGYKHQPVFMIFERHQEPIGLLPLWYEKDKDELRWFGGWWQEGNTLWFKERSLLPLVFSLFRPKVLLNALSVPPRTARRLGLLDDDPKFLLNLNPDFTLDSFLEKFSRKKRYNLKRDRKLILAKAPKTVINRFEDIEKLFELSIKRFSKFKNPEDTSAFTINERKETFREIIRQAGEYKIRTITTEIDQEIVAVDLVAIYKGVYYALNGAYDLEKHPGLGNYSNLLLIEDAFRLGVKAMDFLEVSYGWKESWFEPIPLFQFKGLGE